MICRVLIVLFCWTPVRQPLRLFLLYAGFSILLSFPECLTRLLPFPWVRWNSNTSPHSIALSAMGTCWFKSYVLLTPKSGDQRFTALQCTTLQLCRSRPLWAVKALSRWIMERVAWCLSTHVLRDPAPSRTLGVQSRRLKLQSWLRLCIPYTQSVRTDWGEDHLRSAWSCTILD